MIIKNGHIPDSEIKSIIEKESCDSYTIRDQYENLVLHIPFQDGSPEIMGTNGVSMEDLLVIVSDRLSEFNVGQDACEETSFAIEFIKAAVLELNKRYQRVLEEKK